MIGFSMEAVFDAVKVQTEMDRTTVKALGRFGGSVRKTAMRSLKNAKGISAAGAPPKSHTDLIKDLILYDVDKAALNVIIGPTKLNKPSKTALSALEHGGESVSLQKRKFGTITAKAINVAARPFMQPAFDLMLKNASAEFKDQLGK